MEALQVRVDTLSKSLSDLRSVEGVIPGEGADKIVYKMSDGNRFVAAKIFRDRDAIEEEEIDKPVRAREELDAYRRFRKTSLGLYVPEPYYLLTGDDKSIIGLAIEWRDGIDLSYRTPERPFSQEEFDHLASALRRLTAHDLIPNQDMYMEGNIVIDDNPSSPDRKIWLAECAIPGSEKDVIEHPRRLEHTLAYLAREYIRR